MGGSQGADALVLLFCVLVPLSCLLAAAAVLPVPCRPGGVRDFACGCCSLRLGCFVRSVFGCGRPVPCASVPVWLALRLALLGL